MKNKILSVLLSVAIAFALWLYVVNVISPQSDGNFKNVPVTLQNENILAERGLMITSVTPSMELRLQGNRTDLIKLNSSNITVLANISTIEAPGSFQLNYSVSYPGNISNAAVSVIGSNPALIELTVENRVTKTVPVVVDYGDTQVPEGFIADKENIELDYESIEISGPESVVKTIDRAVIDIDLSNQSETLLGQFDYLLCDAAGEPANAELITTNAESVNLTLKVQRVKEIDLVVEVIEGGGATGLTSTITVEPAKILVAGSEKLLENMDKLELGTINLGEMLEDGELTFPIALPEGISNQTGIAEAKVTVQLGNLKTKTLNVTTIRPMRVPAGMSVDVITKALEVTLRGPEALINSITAEDITVDVDFSGVQPGTATVKADITVSDAYEGVGALGLYSVSATVKKG